VQAATSSYQEESSWVLRLIEDLVEERPSGSVKVTDMWREAKRWLTENDYRYVQFGTFVEVFSGYFPRVGDEFKGVAMRAKQAGLGW
jgi:hypothetical protein